MEVNDDPHPVVAMVAHTYIKVQVNIHTYRVSIDTHGDSMGIHAASDTLYVLCVHCSTSAAVLDVSKLTC